MPFDKRLVALAVILLGVAFTVPPLFRGAMIALAIVAAVLAALPKGTRGLVFATMVGLATGVASINLFAIGIFQGPITKEFGWSQTQYAIVTLVGTVVTVVSSLYIGRLFDRQGVRRWALLGIVLFALALISLYWLTPNPLHFYAVFALMPIIGAGTSSVAYSRVIAAWFDRRRGQAFGAALAGIGIGGAVLSSVSQYLISTVGWRGAYVGLGLLTLERTDLRIRPKGVELDEAEIEATLLARKEARAAKDFAQSDALRDELATKGVDAMDGDPLGWEWQLS